MDLPPFMVLVGPNGAGKTNIVRALELFGDVIKRGTTDPVREQGYDQLIRREKKPARGGLYFAAHVPIPNDVLLRSLHFGGLRHTDEAMKAMGRVSIEAGVTLSGSVYSDEVRVSFEQLTLRNQAGALTLTSKEGKPEVKTTATAEPLLHLFSRTLMGRFALGNEERHAKQLSFLQEALTQEVDPEGRVLKLLNWQRITSPWMRYFRDAVAITRLRLDSSALRKDSTFEESVPDHLIGPNGEGLATAVARMRGSGEHPDERFVPVLRALQRVYPRIEDIRAQRIQPGRLILLFKEHGISEQLGQANVSDGVLHALALLVALEGGLGKGGLLAIEEPENAIHPWSLRAMIGRAQDQPSRQILLTTHSETVVNEVRDTNALFIVENSEKDGTTITPAKACEAALDTILTESGQKLGEVWMDGTVGGVPKSDA